jgi:hypothetical protein
MAFILLPDGKVVEMGKAVTFDWFTEARSEEDRKSVVRERV